MNISRQISQKNLKTILSNHKKTISDLSNKGMPSSKGKKYNDRYEKIRAEIVKEKLLEVINIAYRRFKKTLNIVHNSTLIELKYQTSKLEVYFATEPIHILVPQTKPTKIGFASLPTSTDLF